MTPPRLTRNPDGTLNLYDGPVRIAILRADPTVVSGRVECGVGELAMAHKRLLRRELAERYTRAKLKGGM